MTKKVFIGVGHGGQDPGAVANGLKESQVALDVGLRLNYLLKKAVFQQTFQPVHQKEKIIFKLH